MDKEKSWLTDWNKNPALLLLRKMEFYLILYPHLISKNDNIAWSALSRFDELADPYVVPAILRRFKKEENVDLKQKMIRVLKEIAAKNPQHKNLVKAVPYLIKELDSPKYGIEASKALAEIKDPSVTAALIEVLTDKKPEWHMAVIVLGKIAESGTDISAAIPALTEILNSKHSFDRVNSADVLGKTGDKSTVPALFKTLKDPDETVKFAVAYALVKIAEQLSEKGDYSSGLEIIKGVTAEIKEFYDQKKYKRNRQKIRERRTKYEYFNKVVTHIKERMNSMENKLEWKIPKPKSPPNKKIIKRAKAF